MTKARKTAGELAKLVCERLPSGSVVKVLSDPTHGWSANLLGNQQRLADLKLDVGDVVAELNTIYDLEDG